MVLESKTNLAHGEWIVSPINVPNNEKPATFEADSDGFATGVEGTLYYKLTQGEIILYFDDPYVGSGGFSGQSSSPAYNVQVIGRSGNVCNVTYLISNT